MRVWTKIVIDLKDNTIRKDQSEWTDDYHGPIAECKGGGGGGDGIDKEYNARMATISEANQGMADEMFNLFKYGVTYDPTEEVGRGQYETQEYKAYQQRKRVADLQYRKDLKAYDEGDRIGNRPTRPNIGPAPKQFGLEEIRTKGDIMGYDPNAQISEMELMNQMLTAQSELLPFETDLQKLRIGEESRLLPMQTDLQLEQIGAASELLPHQTSFQKTQLRTGEKLTKERGGVMSAMYKDALHGVDVNKRVSEARAGVQHGFKNSLGIRNRNMGRMGIDPSSGRGLGMTQQDELNRANAMAGAEAGVRTSAEIENFERKRVASGLPI
jgi:hypothetical protein